MKQVVKKVYVALSGGVDSSVALALLHGEGYAVTGVYFKTYKPDGDRAYCREQGLDAQRVCRELGVPFKVFDLEQEYKEKVFNYMIKEYSVGHTPNPDIMCNKEIKFGIFAQRAFAEGADLIATGHYARAGQQFSIFNFKLPNFLIRLIPLIRHYKLIKPHSVLLQAKDKNKDQTYFLSQISPKILKKTLFPLGEYKKSEVRKLANKYGLHTANKKDSQGICFIGQEINVKEFLKKYIPQEAGPVLSTNGTVIGEHVGVRFFTKGERVRSGTGISIESKYQSPEQPRMFIIKRGITTNTLTVGTLAELEEEQRGKSSLLLRDVQWINTVPKDGKVYKCRIRHRGELYKCTLSYNPTWDYMRGSVAKAEDGVVVTFADVPYAPAIGQFLAVYDGDICLGGGVIAE